MSTPLPMPGAAATALQQVRRGWPVALIALAVGLPCLGIIYAAEIAAALGVWIDSTAFNHCFLVLPLAAYLLYERREAVAAASPQPAPLIAAAALPVAICWFVAERIGIMEARQFLAMAIVQILVMAAIGPRTWRVIAPPLLYLFFLVPTGEFLVPWLQDFTVGFIGRGLHLLGVPHFMNGITIEIPEGSFFVAEACAGLRFLVASAAFGVFYACLIYTSPWRRLLFVALSLVVPVIANGFRALGIVYLGHLLGSAQAAVVDHILYGWLFFGLVTTSLILAGLPFRQFAPPALPTRRPLGAVHATATAIGVIAVVMLAAVPRLVAGGLDRAALQGTAAPIVLPLPAHCSSVDPASAGLPQSVPRTAAVALTRGYRCGSDTVVLRLFVFPAHIGAGPVFAALRGAAIVPGWDEIASFPLAAGHRASAARWRVTDLSRQGRFAAVAAALWLDGRPSSGGLMDRFRRAFAALHRGASPPVIAVLATAATGTPERAHAAIERFLRDANDLSGVIPQVASGARRR